MKVAFLILFILLSVTVATGQEAITSVAYITTVYSQNEKFYLKSIPYDNELPSLRGKTYVYEKGKPTPIYVVDKGFDPADGDVNNLILSNDGQVIFYALLWGADEEKEGLKSVTIYRLGQIVGSYTETQINGCDKKQERCSLVYWNYEEVVDRDKSNWGTEKYKKVLKAGTDEKERFLSDFPIFSNDDTVYLTDSKKMVHLFDLERARYSVGVAFDDIFPQLKERARVTRKELQRFDPPTFMEFPKLKDGRNPYTSLADYIGMKAAESGEAKDEQYKIYSFQINSMISQDGSLEIEDIEFYDDLPKEKITEFFKINKFDSSLVPKGFEKWHIKDEYFSFRKKDDQLARQERQEQLTEQQQSLEKQMTAETVEGVYIPKNLGECFVELDRLLPEVDKKEMRALPNRDEMIRYHFGLGMWMRNNWVLWGGSRLQKYFIDKGVTDPEEMSSVILYHYYDWLTGQKETWKDWEKNSVK